MVAVLLLLIRLVTTSILPLTDPTEGRYAVIVQQMVESNDWITPSVWINGELIPFLGKPPLYFWLSALSVKAFGLNEFALRLPSFLSGVLLLCFVYLTVKTVNSRLTAVTGVAIAASSVIFWGTCGAVATDMTFSAMVGISTLSYILFEHEQNRKKKKLYSLSVFTFLGLAFMSKGPVSLIMFGGPVLLWTFYTKSWRSLRDHSWIYGTLIFLLITVPWFIACEKANPGFLKYFFINENILRFITPNYGDRYGHGHQYIRGAAIVMMFIGCLPWSPIAFFRLRKEKLATLKARLNEPAFGIAVAGILFITLFWCLARQLLVTYILPVVPLLAIVLAPSISPKLLKYTLVTWVALITIASVGACIILTGPDTLKGTLKTVQSDEAATNHRTKLAFFRGAPYSAYFYGGKAIAPIPKESIDETLDRCVNMDCDLLLILKKKRFNKLTSLQKNILAIAYEHKPWVFARIIKGAKIAQVSP